MRLSEWFRLAVAIGVGLVGLLMAREVRAVFSSQDVGLALFVAAILYAGWTVNGYFNRATPQTDREAP